MPITHEDLTLRRRWSRWSTDLSSKLALILMIFSVVCGLAAFVLCLAAEASKSEAVWLTKTTKGDSISYQCTYSGSGQKPLACSVAAFLALAVAMFAQHAYMLLAVASPSPPALVNWETTNDPRSSSSKSLVRQACCLFLSTWICFAIAEVILLVAIGVESGHLNNWNQIRSDCIVIRPGLFAAAGIFSLMTVFLGVGLYLTALRAQRLHQEGEDMHQGSAPVSHYPSHHHGLHPTAPQVPHTIGAHEQAPQQGLPHDKHTDSV